MEVFYDVLMEDDGHQLVMRPLLNYTDFSLDPVRAMLSHPTSAWGLGDGGAHCGTTCDASTPRSCSRTGSATARTTSCRSSSS